MEERRKLTNKYQQEIRKAQRQRIIAQKRIWTQLPSVIVQLPYRIQHHDWNMFEELLDSITQQDLAMLDAAMLKYFEEKYDQQFNRSDEDQCNNLNKINLLCIFFRLKIAKNYQLCKLLKFIKEISEQFQSTLKIQKAQILMKLIKQLSIFMQSIKGDDIIQQQLWTEDNLNLINFVCGNLKLYRLSIQIQNKTELAELIKNYRIYYVFLLADQKLKFKDYLLAKNIGQIFYLIDQCLNYLDFLQIIKSIQIIIKIIKFKNDSDQNTVICLKGLEVLLIDGIQQSKHFLNSPLSKTLSQFQPKYTNMFFKQLLNIFNSADIRTVLKLIELLAELFDISDNYINAVFKINLQIKQDTKSSKIQKDVQIVKPKQFHSYLQLFLFHMENILSEVRYKTFWMISNVTGSQKYFHQFGFNFIQQIFISNYLQSQKQCPKIQNQINICILNYLCNINNKQHITKLISLKRPITQTQAVDRADDVNCFIYFISIVCFTIRNIYETTQSHGVSFYQNKQNIFLHRTVYAVYNIINILKEDGTLQQQLTSVIRILQSHTFQFYIQKICQSSLSQQILSKDVMSLIDSILKCLQQEQNEQKLL